MNDLLERARHGDGEAFVMLFERHKQALWKTAMAVLEDSTDASDALQETVIKAWRAIPNFKGNSSLSTWLTRILLRTCFDMLRAQRRELPFTAIFSEEEHEGGLRGADRLIAEAHAAMGGYHQPDQTDGIDVRRTMAKLSPNDRLLLALFYINDCPIKEIAAVLGTTEGAIRTRLTRARERFRQVYAGVEIRDVEVVR